MSQHNHAQQQQQQQQRKPFLQMSNKRDEDEYAQSYVAMLNVLRKYYELTGDVFVKPIIDKAERALGRR